MSIVEIAARMLWSAAPEGEARSIRVEVRAGDTVTLIGKVDTWSKRMAIERAVRTTAGVRAVVDHLSIA